MGDWSIGTFNAGGFKEGVDYLCGQAPADNGKTGFILNSDSVVFFQQKDPEYLAGSKLLAHLIMSKDFQIIFNQAKGSIPARLDVDLTKVSILARKSARRIWTIRSKRARWCAALPTI